MWRTLRNKAALQIPLHHHTPATAGTMIQVKRLVALFWDYGEDPNVTEKV